MFILFYYRVILTLSTSVYVRNGERWVMHAGVWVSECVCVCVCVCVCARAKTAMLVIGAFLAVIELLFGSVLKVGFYITKWNVTYKCVCVRARVSCCYWTRIRLCLKSRILYYEMECYL